MNSLASELCLISACSRLNWIYCYFIYLFFKTFKIRIFKVKFVFPYFEGIFVQNTGNSYYLAGLGMSLAVSLYNFKMAVISDFTGHCIYIKLTHKPNPIKYSPHTHTRDKFVGRHAKKKKNACSPSYLKILAVGVDFQKIRSFLDQIWMLVGSRYNLILIGKQTSQSDICRLK